MASEEGAGASRDLRLASWKSPTHEAGCVRGQSPAGTPGSPGSRGSSHRGSLRGPKLPSPPVSLGTVTGPPESPSKTGFPNAGISCPLKNRRMLGQNMGVILIQFSVTGAVQTGVGAAQPHTHRHTVVSPGRDTEAGTGLLLPLEVTETLPHASLPPSPLRAPPHGAHSQEARVLVLTLTITFSSMMLGKVTSLLWT